MSFIYFGGIKFIIEQEIMDRHGLYIMNIYCPGTDIRLVATKDIREDFWLLSNGQRFNVEEVCRKEEI